MGKNIITSWEDFQYEYSKEVIVNYDVHYKSLRKNLREILKSRKYEGEPITESTYLLKKLKKTALIRLEEEIKLQYEKVKLELNENERNTKGVRIIFLLPDNDVFLERVIIDEVVTDTVND